MPRLPDSDVEAATGPFAGLTSTLNTAFSALPLPSCSTAPAVSIPCFPSCLRRVDSDDSLHTQQEGLRSQPQQHYAANGQPDWSDAINSIPRARPDELAGLLRSTSSTSSFDPAADTDAVSLYSNFGIGRRRRNKKKKKKHRENQGEGRVTLFGWDVLASIAGVGRIAGRAQEEERGIRLPEDEADALYGPPTIDSADPQLGQAARYRDEPEDEDNGPSSSPPKRSTAKSRAIDVQSTCSTRVTPSIAADTEDNDGRAEVSKVSLLSGRTWDSDAAPLSPSVIAQLSSFVGAVTEDQDATPKPKKKSKSKRKEQQPPPPPQEFSHPHEDDVEFAFQLSTADIAAAAAAHFSRPSSSVAASRAGSNAGDTPKELRHDDAIAHPVIDEDNAGFAFELSAADVAAAQETALRKAQEKEERRAARRARKLLKAQLESALPGEGAIVDGKRRDSDASKFKLGDTSSNPHLPLGAEAAAGFEGFQGSGAMMPSLKSLANSTADVDSARGQISSKHSKTSKHSQSQTSHSRVSSTSGTTTSGFGAFVHVPTASTLPTSPSDSTPSNSNRVVKKDSLDDEDDAQALADLGGGMYAGPKRGLPPSRVSGQSGSNSKRSGSRLSSHSNHSNPISHESYQSNPVTSASTNPTYSRRGSKANTAASTHLSSSPTVGAHNPLARPIGGSTTHTVHSRKNSRSSGAGSGVDVSSKYPTSPLAQDSFSPSTPGGGLKGGPSLLSASLSASRDSASLASRLSDISKDSVSTMSRESGNSTQTRRGSVPVQPPASRTAQGFGNPMRTDHGLTFFDSPHAGLDNNNDDDDDDGHDEHLSTHLAHPAHTRPSFNARGGSRDPKHTLKHAHSTAALESTSPAISIPFGGANAKSRSNSVGNGLAPQNSIAGGLGLARSPFPSAGLSSMGLGFGGATAGLRAANGATVHGPGRGIGGGSGRAVGGGNSGFGGQSVKAREAARFLAG